jgi:DNA-binding NarL/FixJ family response regulator
MRRDQPMNRSSERTKAKARILIVDDHPIMREGLRMRISAQSDMEVCGEAATTAEALAWARKEPPDLVSVDISLGDDSGLDLIQRLKAQGYDSKILVLSAHDDALYAERALKAGAHGYIGKSEAQGNILNALRVVLAGGCYLNPKLNRQLIGRAVGASLRGPTTPTDALSNRELQVFQLIGQGLSSKAIAARLQLSPHTIDSHREKIKIKLSLNNALELQRAALQWMLAADRSA